MPNWLLAQCHLSSDGSRRHREGGEGWGAAPWIKVTARPPSLCPGLGRHCEQETPRCRHWVQHAQESGVGGFVSTATSTVRRWAQSPPPATGLGCASAQPELKPWPGPEPWLQPQGGDSGQTEQAGTADGFCSCHAWAHSQRQRDCGSSTGHLVGEQTSRSAFLRACRLLFLDQKLREGRGCSVSPGGPGT